MRRSRLMAPYFLGSTRDGGEDLAPFNPREYFRRTE
jgi:hypothetical protein